MIIKGGFTRLDYSQSGLELRGEVKDIFWKSPTGKKDCLLFLINNDYPALYEIKEKSKNLMPLQ